MGAELGPTFFGWAVYCSQGVPVVGVDGLRDSGYVRFQFHGGSGGQSSIDFVDKAAVPGVFHDGSVCLPAAHRSGEESAVVRGSGPSALVAQEEGFVESDGPGVLRPGSYDGDHLLGGVHVEEETDGLAVIYNIRCAAHSCPFVQLKIINVLLEMLDHLRCQGEGLVGDLGEVLRLGFHHLDRQLGLAALDSFSCIGVVVEVLCEARVAQHTVASIGGSSLFGVALVERRVGCSVEVDGTPLYSDITISSPLGLTAIPSSHPPGVVPLLTGTF